MAPLGLYYRTIIHLLPSQVYHWARRRARLALGNGRKTRSQPLSHLYLRPLDSAGLFPEALRDEYLKMLVTQRFSFLNHTVDCSGKFPWEERSLSQLWKLNLHYFNYVDISLPENGGPSWFHRIHTITEDWIKTNPVGYGTGWLPYAVSLRVVNWLKFLGRNGHLIPQVEIDPLLASLHEQASFLERNLEFDLRANHLIKNAKALLFASAMLVAPEGRRWWKRGEELLTSQLNEQILSDGGHFERSPMYHMEVLEDFLDIRAIALACGRVMDCAPQLSECIAKMGGFLRRILHPDGEIPLFNDSALGVARPARELLVRAGESVEVPSNNSPEVAVLPETGYAVLRAPSSESCLILDCGPLGPDYQPGHGHCDVLSYELSLHGQRVVVDTGASTYERCAERLYERSTAAHNTLRIDGEEQAEVWASFRVGRRPRAGRLEGGEINKLYFVQGVHHAYQHRGVIHSRMIALTPRNSWLVIDSLNGKGKHLVESFIHFHPAVRVEMQNNSAPGGAGTGATSWNIRFGEHQYLLTTHWSGELAARESWYAPEFGLRQRQTTLHWTWRGDLPVRLAYAFTPAGQRPPFIPLDLTQEGVEIVHTALASS